MAARTNRVLHDERTKNKIRATQLWNRLESYAMDKVEMKPSQVTAALGLLKKVMPDLQAMELKGDGGGPVQIVLSRDDSEL